MYASLQEFTNAGGAASDNCALEPGSFKFVGQVQSSVNCPYTLTLTYEISDVSGNVATAEHQIIIEGTGAGPQPEAVVEPAKKEVLTLKSAMATTFTAVQTGNWDDPATWSSTVTPSSTDNVIIPTGFTVTVDAAAFCNNITIDGSLKSGGAYTLQVNSNWTNNGTFTAGNWDSCFFKFRFYNQWHNNI